MKSKEKRDPLQFIYIPKRTKKAVPPIKYAPGNLSKTLCFPAPRKKIKLTQLDLFQLLDRE